MLRLRRWIAAVVLAGLVVVVVVQLQRGGGPPPDARPGHVESGSAQSAPASGPRDKYRWPFSPTSFWNTPIGSAAAYRPLQLTAPSLGYGVDVVYLEFAPDAPLRQLRERDYWWPWEDGDRAAGESTGVAVRVDDDWVVPPPRRTELPNRASAALEPSGLVREFQYTVRPVAGSDISMYERPRGRIDLAGDGHMIGGAMGGHGGSGMTGVGGTLRAGELTGSEPIRHALAVTMNMRKWGVPQGGGIRDGHRWPATTADGHFAQRSFASGYGTIRLDGAAGRPGVGMGALLAIPADVDLDALGFETPEGAKLAWTHKNYGAYVVDSSEDDGRHDIHLLNVEARALEEFPGFETAGDTAFGRDLTRIFTHLALVENNGPTSVGGGGTPRQPPAGPIAR